jgi:PAS domain S-box-containing protein
LSVLSKPTPAIYSRKAARPSGKPGSRQRLERHRNAQGEYEQQYLNGLTLLMTDRRTPDGGTVCMYSDISEKKRLEVEHRIAAIAFEFRKALRLPTPRWSFSGSTGAFTEITGYNTEEIVGKTPALLSSGRHDAAFFAACGKVLHVPGRGREKSGIGRKCGEIYPAWLMITAVKDKAGTVTNYVGTFADITARKAAEEEINSLAFFDPLTGLPNRRLLLDRLKQALASSTRNVKYGALLFIDLDHFKTSTIRVAMILATCCCNRSPATDHLRAREAIPWPDLAATSSW